MHADRVKLGPAGANFLLGAKIASFIQGLFLVPIDASWITEHPGTKLGSGQPLPGDISDFLGYIKTLRNDLSSTGQSI